ncbi:hypothetical protein [Methylocapsa sp. S129]|uniref:hypothetical protein n=1 Tax=Methylocapsa sp. S129 TaxID=1641869 RepID=UPI00131E0F4F|nr:hypothetical protein [Methylocapsa sp. S129]
MANFSIPASNDAAEDAARLLQRLGYVVLALGAPCAEALSSRAIFLFFPIGMALLLVAALLSPVQGVGERLNQALWSPLGLVSLALFAWSALSLAWTPFPVEAVEHLFKLVGTALVVIVGIACSRDHMRAADLYLFPVGVVLAMLAILALALADHAGIGSYAERIERSGVALVVMLWPAMAGLAARGRTGLARLLMILTAAFIFAIGAPVTAAALFVGLLALSFAMSDVKRTVFDLGVLAAAIVVLSPLAPAISPTLARWFFHAKLSSLSGPFAPLAGAAEILLHEPFRLFTGHGIDTSIRGVETGLTAPIPRVGLFEIWYELGIIGALLGAALTWLGFRGVGATGAKIAPYLLAAFACDLTLAFLSEDFSQMSWVTLLAVSAISAGAAARSQYRTKRPSATTTQQASL